MRNTVLKVQVLKTTETGPQVLSYQAFCILKQKHELESSNQHFPIHSVLIKIWRPKGADSRQQLQ